MLFRRLFVPLLILIVALAGTVGTVAASQMRSSRIDAIREELRQEARLVLLLVADDLRAGRIEDAGRKLRGMEHRRITVVDGTGRVLIDTMGQPAAMENHLQRPEIVEAAAVGIGSQVRRSDSVHAEMMYLALRSPPIDGKIYFIRTSVAFDDLRRDLAALYSGLALATLAALGIAGGICYAIVRRQTRPLVELTRLAEGLASGDLARRSRLQEAGEIGSLARALNGMADSIATLVGQARKDREELRTILVAMGEGVIAVDKQQRILLVNPGAATLLDFSADQAEGRSLWQVVRNEALLKAAAEAVATATQRTLQLEPDRGRRIDVVVRSWPAAGEPEGAVIVAQDVTEATRYQELRKEFVANVSHEFRTPLTLIKGFVETLQDGAIDDPVKGPEYLRTIVKHVDQLTNLVSDLLELSRIESRPGLPRRLAVDLADISRRVVELIAPAAEKRRQRLALDLAPDLARVDGDPDYLQRAVSNLVENAVKYTADEGAITLRARNDGAAVVIEVADNGIGIPAEDLPRVFERFYRVDKSRSKDMGGTGLGLSIVKHVVQAHDGSVTVESEPGRGSTFRVRLPASAGA